MEDESRMLFTNLERIWSGGLMEKFYKRTTGYMRLVSPVCFEG